MPPVNIVDTQTTFGNILDYNCDMYKHQDVVREHITSLMTEMYDRWPGRFYNYILGQFGKRKSYIFS